MSAILIYSDKENLTLELLSGAQSIAKEIGADVKVLSINNDAQADALSQKGAKVYAIKNDALNIADTAALAAALQEAAASLDCDTILLSSNRRGKELAGRLAQKLNAACLSDVNKVEVKNGKIECQRNSLGGATVAVQNAEVDKQVIAISPKTFEPASEVASGSIEALAVNVQSSGVKVLEVREKQSDAVDIEAAEVLLVLGQGLDNQNDIPLFEDLAKAIGAEVACTKPVATDKKWFSEERVVGLSGKICKPSLALLFGVSGQVQFTVGIRDAKTIITVNTDENAPMMSMSDYIWQGDLIEAVKELKQKI